MRMTMEQIASMSRGGGVKYFKINAGETVQVRFLYNTVMDIPYYQVHEAMSQNKRPIYINCGIESEMDTIESCKWCKENFPLRVRIPLAVYNETTKEIEFWIRTRKWFEGNALPYLNMLTSDTPIVSQVYSITRTGTSIQNTNYLVAPLGQPDGKTLNDFEAVPDVIESGVFRASDYILPVGAYNPATAVDTVVGQQPIMPQTNMQNPYMQQPQQPMFNGYMGDMNTQANTSATNNVFGTPQQQGPSFAPRRTTQVF